MTSGIAVEALTLTLGAFRLTKIDFTVAPGEILVILGPNGAGKSVTLETIAGFHRPDSGRVRIGGRDATTLPPEQRNVGFVVQNFGLFPHLSVAQNVAIARRRAPTATAARDVSLPPIGDDAALLAYFGIARLAQRLPADLSPGEKQRVALARALAGGPDLFLFDEPFSALDGQTAEQLRNELLSFLRKLAIPAIFVTHDRTDATTLADKIFVLRDGDMIQSGPAAEIFEKPANSFVARFVGVENIVPGRLIETSGCCATLEVGGQMLKAAAPAAPLAGGSPVFLGIRAENVIVRSLAPDEIAQKSINRLRGHVTGLQSAGPLTTVSIDCGFPLKAYALRPSVRSMNLAVDDIVTVEIARYAIHVMTK
jgi:molybdate/tungstate transport system ATP-binding protein